MDVAVQLIRHASAVHRFGDIHVAGQQFGVTPAASARTAVGRGIQPRRFHRAEKGSVRLAVDRGRFPRDRDGHLVGFLGIARIIGVFLGVEIFAEEFVTDELAADAEFFDLLIREIVHRLRSAHKDREIALGRIFLDEVCGDKAAFAARLLLIGKDVYEADLVVCFRPRRDLVAEDGVFVGAAAVEENEGAGFVALVDRLRQGAEGGDAAAARDTDHGLGVTQSLVGEVAEGGGNRHLHTFLPVVEDILGYDAAADPLDRQHIGAVQGVRGRGRDRVGTLIDLAVDIDAYTEILSRREPGEFFGARLFIGGEDDALHIGREGVDLLDHDVLRLGMQFGCEFVGIVFEQGLCGGVGRLADGAEPLGNDADEPGAGEFIDLGLAHLICPPCVNLSRLFYRSCLR